MSQKELARRFLEEAWSGDLALADELVAGDAEAPHDGQFPAGPDGWKQEIQLVRAGLPDLQVKVVEMVEEGNAVAVRWRSRGTHAGRSSGSRPLESRWRSTAYRMVSPSREVAAAEASSTSATGSSPTTSRSRTGSRS